MLTSFKRLHFDTDGAIVHTNRRQLNLAVVKI